MVPLRGRELRLSLPGERGKKSRRSTAVLASASEELALTPTLPPLRCGTMVSLRGRELRLSLPGEKGKKSRRSTAVLASACEFRPPPPEGEG
jgi:hypothetical protein